MKLILIRHLKTEFCAGDHYCGRTDCDICADDELVLDDAVKALFTGEPVAVYSSPLKRCVETVQQLERLVPVDCVTFCDALSERDYGIYNGVDKATVKAKIAAGEEVDFRQDGRLRPPLGESQTDVRNRVFRWLDTIKEKHETVGIVTHQGVLREIYAWLRARAFEKFQPGEMRIEENVNVDKSTAFSD